MKIFDRLEVQERELLLRLEKQDAEEREKNIDRKLRLRQIPRETGEYLYLIISLQLDYNKNWLGLEIGASGGYSTIWQSLALKIYGEGKLFSLEIDSNKVKLAESNINKLGLKKYTSIVHIDAKEYIKNSQEKYNFIFMDAEKSDYQLYLEQLKKHTDPGSICIIDNVISHAEDLKDFFVFMNNDEKILYSILPIGKGLGFIKFL
jgi:predicted O-methyltransferase YrrM